MKLLISSNGFIEKFTIPVKITYERKPHYVNYGTEAPPIVKSRNYALIIRSQNGRQQVSFVISKTSKPKSFTKKLEVSKKFKLLINNS